MDRPRANSAAVCAGLEVKTIYCLLEFDPKVDGFLRGADLRTWFDFYNHQRPHAALDGQPPDVVYRDGTTIMQPDQETRKVA